MTDADQQATTDPRHQKRIKQMQQLFALSFSDQDIQQANQEEYSDFIKDLLAHLEEIDTKLQSAAPERPLSDINKVDLAILRLIMFESEHKKTPKKVLINEAVELAKEFGTESSPRLVNGVLGKLLMTQPE